MLVVTVVFVAVLLLVAYHLVSDSSRHNSKLDGTGIKSSLVTQHLTPQSVDITSNEPLVCISSPSLPIRETIQQELHEASSVKGSDTDSSGSFCSRVDSNISPQDIRQYISSLQISYADIAGILESCKDKFGRSISKETLTATLKSMSNVAINTDETKVLINTGIDIQSVELLKKKVGNIGGPFSKEEFTNLVYMHLGTVALKTPLLDYLKDFHVYKECGDMFYPYNMKADLQDNANTVYVNKSVSTCQLTAIKSEPKVESDIVERQVRKLLSSIKPIDTTVTSILKKYKERFGENVSREALIFAAKAMPNVILTNNQKRIIANTGIDLKLVENLKDEVQHIGGPLLTDQLEDLIRRHLGVSVVNPFLMKCLKHLNVYRKRNHALYPFHAAPPVKEDPLVKSSFLRPASSSATTFCTSTVTAVAENVSEDPVYSTQKQTLASTSKMLPPLKQFSDDASHYPLTALPNNIPLSLMEENIKELLSSMKPGFYSLSSIRNKYKNRFADDISVEYASSIIKRTSSFVFRNSHSSSTVLVNTEINWEFINYVKNIMHTLNRPVSFNEFNDIICAFPGPRTSLPDVGPKLLHYLSFFGSIRVVGKMVHPIRTPLPSKSAAVKVNTSAHAITTVTPVKEPQTDSYSTAARTTVGEENIGQSLIHSETQHAQGTSTSKKFDPEMATYSDPQIKESNVATIDLNNKDKIRKVLCAHERLDYPSELQTRFKEMIGHSLEIPNENNFIISLLGSISLRIECDGKGGITLIALKELVDSTQETFTD